MRDGLTQDQVSLVLRRAAELDQQFGLPGDAGIDEATLEQAAVEAGLSPEAIRRALAELRSGMLEPAPPRHRGVLGEPTLALCRTVPGPIAAVEQHISRFLHDQLFELRRDRGTRTTWIRRRGLEASARRAIDRAGQRRLVLRDVHHVDVSLVDEAGEDRWVLVRLDVDVLAIRHTQGKVTGSTAVVGAGMALTTAAVAGFRPVFMVTAAAGAGLAGFGHWTGSRLYRNRVGDIESGVGGMLDRLEHGDRARTIDRGRHP